MHELKSLDYCFVKENGGGYTSEIGRAGGSASKERGCGNYEN